MKVGDGEIAVFHEGELVQLGSHEELVLESGYRAF